MDPAAQRSPVASAHVPAKVAVPIRSAGGQVLAAMNVSALAGRMSAEELVRTALPVLQAAADSVRPSLVG